MGHLHICCIIYSICIERRKCILPSWPQIYKPRDVINGCYVIFGYPSCHQIDLNRHQTILHNFFNFSSIERYHACHIFCKQISNEQKSQICVKCVIWKQIHEKWESVITESWPTFSNGRVRYWAGPSYQPPSATEWPHYIMNNWPRVVPQKAHRCEDKQKSFDLPLLLGKASV